MSDYLEQDNRPMHPTLKARVLGLARQYKAEQEAFEAAAKALVLCPPDCKARHSRFPQEHCHTFWDMWRAREACDYGWQLQQRQQELEDMARMDVTPHLSRAGVGATHIQRLTGLDMARPAVVATSRWLKQARPMPLPWLALLGATDAGKTQAAVCALSHFVRRHPWGQSAGFGGEAQRPPFLLVHGSEVASLARTLRDFSAAAGAREREEDWRKAKVLVLDDVGAERMDPDTLGLLHSVADQRYRERRMTVWTANMSAEDFEKRLDFGGEAGGEQRGRLWRRIRELGHVVQLGRRVRTWEGGRETTPTEAAR